MDKIRLKYTILIVLFGFFMACIDDDPVTNDEIIKFIILDEDGGEIDTVIGNGTDRITLRAELPDEVGNQFETVTFKTTSGTFFGTTETMVKERVDAEGVAEVILIVPLDSGSLFLTAEIGPDSDTYQAKQTVALVGVDNVLNLNFKTLDGQTLSIVPRADGTSVFNVESEVLVSKKKLNSVTFVSTDGEFIETGNTSAKKSTDTDGVAKAGFKVPQGIGPIFYTATTGSSNQYSIIDNLEFLPAKADEIFIEPTTLSMTTSTGNVINAFLTRNVGKVSLETDVDFDAFQIVDSIKIKVGRFTGESIANTDENGQAFATFFADTGDFDTTLPITIEVSTINDAGLSISASISLMVNE